jgi:NDP-sugar pyrophosphorylase family protein
MKALLICPDERFGVAALAESAPLANTVILGKTLVEYWLEHLAAAGATEVLVLAVDRPEEVRAAIGGGARWGLRVTVKPEKCERTPDEARTLYKTGDAAAWLPVGKDVVLMEHLPGFPELPLFTSYADWYAAVQAWVPNALTPDRIGIREREPGIWVGLNAHVAADAHLIAPCWVGDGVWIETGAVVGPHAVLEREVCVARGAEVSHSVVQAETFVGQFTAVHRSIASGSTLINWQMDSCLKVPDAYLLCPREPQPSREQPAGNRATCLAPGSASARFRQYVMRLLT